MVPAMGLAMGMVWAASMIGHDRAVMHLFMPSAEAVSSARDVSQACRSIAFTLDRGLLFAVTYAVLQIAKV